MVASGDGGATSVTRALSTPTVTPLTTTVPTAVQNHHLPSNELSFWTIGGGMSLSCTSRSMT